MRHCRRVMAVVAVVVSTTALAVVTSPTASTASTPPSGDEAEALGLLWSDCVNGSTSVIFRRLGDECGEGQDSVGFAALTRQPGGYRLQVCAQLTDTIGMWVDPADANGNSTGNTIYYSDPPYGPCFNRDIGYRIRKFQAVHLVSGLDRVYFSAWMLAPDW
jgi:hypothetical protein